MGRLLRFEDWERSGPPDVPLRLNAHGHVFERLCRLLVFEPSGRATADGASWLGSPLLHRLLVLTGVDGLDAGQLLKDLRLVVLIVAVA